MDSYLNSILFAIPACLLAYLIGSISTAIITCKIMGIEDPRKTGSNNPGATNVLRHGGKKAAIITLIGDALKGLIPVLVAIQLQADILTVSLVGLFALLGHVFPVYYGFKGGKGVATYYGVILAMNWMVGLIALAIWLSTAAALKISSLAALISIFSVPIILWHFSQSVELAGVVALMSVLVFWRHKKNIQALLQGTEARISKR
ncbi:Acyl-phosphate:glycerol-3-phosphate O-acyltransferase PlsY (EC 2.3.1.n3) [hydrothermal vent metagenome]|uniref:Acyl-phosphate:glycerol-3-phosphate O-acyltransferase PlsY n=1 Tax=hydrothermal vent metagenome TaxID=652676 RepID=A0A3B0W9X7_9ZZZZ